MTVSTTSNRISYTGNGVTTVFAFPYKFITTSDLVVYVADVLQTSGYTVGTPSDTGANVTFSSAPANAATIVILCSPDRLQSSALPSTGPFPAKTVETMSDKLTLLVQRLYDLASRSLTLSDSDVTTVSTVLPSPQASALIGWNNGLTGLQNVPIASLATTIVANTWKVDSFNGDGVTTVFSLSSPPGNTNALILSISGVAQKPGTDFTVVGTTLTFAGAPPAGTGNIVAQYGQSLSTVGTADLTNTVNSLDGSKLSGSVAASLVTGSLTNATGVTAPQFDNDTSLATTAFVQRALGNFSGVKYVTVPYTILAADAGKILIATGTGNVTFPTGLDAGFAVVVQPKINADSINVVASAGSFSYGGYSTATITLGNDGSVILTSQGPSDLPLVTSGGLKSSPNFLSSKATSGYQKLPGGLIIQWGAFTLSAGASGTVTYPIAFPTTVLAVTFGNAYSTGGATILASIGGNYTGTTTSFTAYNQGGSSQTNATYIAIGY